MGTKQSVGTDTLWGHLRLPRNADGTLDELAFRASARRHWPMFVALAGLGWLTANGMATDQWNLSIALLSSIPLWITSRAWRLPLWLQIAAASFPLSIALVSLVHLDPTGLSRATKYAYAVALFLGVVAWARTSKRRTGLGLALVALVMYGFVLSWTHWWLNGSDPWRLMRGTLEWHNQFAAHMLTGLALGLVIGVLGRGKWMILALSGAVVCGAGVLMSGSRFGGVLALAVVGAGLAAATYAGYSRRSWTPLGRWLVGVGGALLLPLVLRSGLFFPRGEVIPNPLGTILQRGGLDSSGSIRLRWWIASWQMGVDHPLAGVGLLQFDNWVTCYGVRPQWHPHNEWAYAWAEGGLIGSIPLLLVFVGVVVLIIRMLRPWPTALSLAADPARWGAAAAVVVALADLWVEYDLFYPVLLALFALSGAIAAAPAVGVVDRSRSRSLGIAVGVAIAVLAVAVAGVLADPLVNELPWTERYVKECLRSIE